MPYATREQLEAIRSTVTGVGWADTRQAAIYLNVPHPRFCKSILPNLTYSKFGDQTRRIQYSELDRWASEQAAEQEQIEDIVNSALERLEI